MKTIVENVVIELLKAKCLPTLYYGLDACPINKSQIKSLDFALNNAFRKIFLTKYTGSHHTYTFMHSSQFVNSIFNKKFAQTYFSRL